MKYEVELIDNEAARVVWSNGCYQDIALNEGDIDRIRNGADPVAEEWKDSAGYIVCYDNCIPNEDALIVLANDILEAIPKNLKDGIMIEGESGEKALRDAIVNEIGRNNDCACIPEEIWRPRIDGFEDETVKDIVKLIVKEIEDARDSEDGCGEIGLHAIAWTKDRYAINSTSENNADARETLYAAMFGDKSLDCWTDEELANKQEFIEWAVDNWDNDQAKVSDVWITEDNLRKMLNTVFDEEYEQHMKDQEESE